VTRARQLVASATLVSCALLVPAPSQACGGCFGPPSFSSTTTVTGHRMAFAVSDERTVLWDSFEYTGAPEDFSWVLPVLPGAVLEESTDAWFETLETVTRTNVTSPLLTCASPSGGGVGCGSSSADSAGLAAPNGGFYDGGVMVLHQGTVGPYETVTLRSTDGDALTTWLKGHGYAIPPDIQPTIDDYTSQGNDFIALRLQPGISVQKMTPVRVVTPGGEFLLPLRMVAAGVAEHVNIVLYVIGEQRYAMPDLHEVSVDPSQLTWTFADNSNNYAELHRQALAKNLGFSYLPAFAHRGGFASSLPGANGGQARFVVQNSTNFNSYTNFADLYFAQAAANDNKPLNGCSSIVPLLNGTRLVTADGRDGTLSATELECEKHTDISAAMLGMHPANVWLTRLELDLPKEALSMDCTVVPADSQATVSNQLRAAHAKDRPSGCEEVVFESKLARGLPGRGSLVFLALFGGLLWLRRRGAAC
jgi:hypothetical protein